MILEFLFQPGDVGKIILDHPSLGHAVRIRNAVQNKFRLPHRQAIQLKGVVAHSFRARRSGSQIIAQCRNDRLRRVKQGQGVLIAAEAPLDANIFSLLYHIRFGNGAFLLVFSKYDSTLFHFAAAYDTAPRLLGPLAPDRDAALAAVGTGKQSQIISSTAVGVKVSKSTIPPFRFAPQQVSAQKASRRQKRSADRVRECARAAGGRQFKAWLVLDRQVQLLAVMEGAGHFVFRVVPSGDRDFSILVDRNHDLLGNLWQNALESCEKLAPPAERYIKTSITVKQNKFMLQCVNSAAAVRRDEDGLYISTKGLGHGNGLPSIKDIVSLYDGFCEFGFDGQEFSCSAVLPLPVSVGGEQ